MSRKFFPMTLVAALVAGVVGFAGVPYSAQGAEPTSAATEGEYKGEHEMTGKVTKIDPKAGMVNLNTALGDMSLHFPPPAVADLKQGDEITVRLGYKKAR